MSEKHTQVVFEKYIVPIVTALVIAGIISFFTIFFQVQKAADLTHSQLIQTQEKLVGMDRMVMTLQKEVRSDLKEINDKLNQISILNTKIYELERRLDRLEEIEKKR